jgi:hypothetical protein
VSVNNWVTLQGQEREGLAVFVVVQIHPPWMNLSYQQTTLTMEWGRDVCQEKHEVHSISTLQMQIISSAFISFILTLPVVLICFVI